MPTYALPSYADKHLAMHVQSMATSGHLNWSNTEGMERLLSPARRETTDSMVDNIGRELAEIEQAIGRCRGDALGEPRLTGCWMAHLLISSQALLHNLLIDTARRPSGYMT